MEPGRQVVDSHRKSRLGVGAAGERDEPACIVGRVGMGKPIPQLQPHLPVVGVPGELGGVRIAERPHPS